MNNVSAQQNQVVYQPVQGFVLQRSTPAFRINFFFTTLTDLSDIDLSSLKIGDRRKKHGSVVCTLDGQSAS